MANASKQHLSMRRSGALAVVMVGIFLGSLGIASLLTTNREHDFDSLPITTPPSNNQPEPLAEPTNTSGQLAPRWISLGGLDIPTPATWNTVDKSLDPSWAQLTERSVILADPNRPTRRLRIGYINTPEGTSAAEVYDTLLGEDKPYFEPIESNLRPFLTSTHSGGVLAKEVQIRIQSDDGSIDRLANSLIAICVMSRNNDGRRFWLIYFSDLLPDGAQGQRLAREGYALVTLAGRYARPTNDATTEISTP
ncbi:MAG: hypothetical protein RLN76_01495 [Phycisphaeraceae bacterium]